MSRMIDDEETLKDNGLIEIDGVNVAECVCYQKEVYTATEIFYNHCLETNKCCGSKDNYNCYFKQLQRVKAENEKIITENENLQEANEEYAAINKHLDYMLGDVIAKVLEDDDTEEYFYTELKEKFTTKLEEIINENKTLKEELEEKQQTLEACEAEYRRIINKLNELKPS